MGGKIMFQTIMEHNVNADWFFSWMEEHWKYYNGSSEDRIYMITMFENDVCPFGSTEFVLPSDSTFSGKQEVYKDFNRVWFKTYKDSECVDDYIFIHGYVYLGDV